MSNNRGIFKGYRNSPEIISEAVYLYYRFPLSLRDVEALLAWRGIAVTYETIRVWKDRFGPEYARSLKRRRARPGQRWHLDEVFVKIGGVTHYMWRAVDDNGYVLDVVVTRRRNKRAAYRFLRRLVGNRRRLPRVVVTDGLGSYVEPIAKLLPKAEHRVSQYLNNRAECSHQPIRVRERRMKRFKSRRQAETFARVHGVIHGDIAPRRHGTRWHHSMRELRRENWTEITKRLAAA